MFQNHNLNKMSQSTQSAQSTEPTEPTEPTKSTNNLYLQKQDNIYLDAEKTWNSSPLTNAEKKYMSWQYLAWCKRIRDFFDNVTSDPISKITEDISEDIENHEIKWAVRVTTWRQRFNEFHPN